jgi:non-specific serine/threonine protein kinase
MPLLDAINDYLDAQPKTQIDKGRRIALGNPPVTLVDDSDSDFHVRVPSENTRKVYNVTIDYDEYDELMLNCDCLAFDDLDDCKHCVAACLKIKNILLEEIEAKLGAAEKKAAPNVDADGYFHFLMENIDIYTLLKLSGNPNPNTIYKIANNAKPGAFGMPHQCFSYYEKEKKVADTDIVFDGVNGFKTRCTCGDVKHPVCKHVLGGFYFIENRYNRYYFSRFKTFTVEKNKILSLYGLQLDDPEAKDFKWEVSDWGELRLKKKPEYLIPAGSSEFLQKMKHSILGAGETHYAAVRPRLPESTMIDYEIGYLLNFASTKHIDFELEPVLVRDKKGKADVKKLSLGNQANYQYLQPLTDEMYSNILEFSDQKLIDWLAQNGSPYLKSYSNPWSYVGGNEAWKLKKYYFGLLKKIWPELCNAQFAFQLLEGRFSNANVQPVKLSNTPVNLTFSAAADERFITIKLSLKIEGADKKTKAKFQLKSGLVFDINGILHLPNSMDDLLLLQQFAGGLLKFPVKDLLQVIRNVILPLQAKYEVTIDRSLNYESIEPEPQAHLLVSEFDNKFLMLKPRFQYNDLMIEYDDESEVIQQNGGSLLIVQRNKPEEKKLYEFLRTLHPKFASQRNNLYYYLPFDEVMKGGWFLSMTQRVQEAGYPVYGLQDLKTFRYNTNKPTFDIEAGSGVDWFDLKIEISWGDQQVSLKDIRKAILNKQEAVLLDDGTLGLIPAEWLEQYGLMLKIGTEKDGHVKVSKLHYNLLDELGDKLNNEQVQLEIAEKKQRLLNFTGTEKHEPQSTAVTAQLRPYQQAGFQWLQALDGLGWGGCLADDMGLGKTLQTITFLQFVKEKYPGSTQLIICPTSLIFNWENELNKFCPTLKYHTYYGNMRSFDDNHFEQFDIILTTYGVIRLDIEHLIQFNWHYIILDESQAIKNPDAQVTKSVQLLNAKNRLILSGTPVQNNTYDLFAQFNFINPGFLGHRDFFKQEFANPIDKAGDKVKSEQLRKMVYPFMLRRTKEQVATDLPDKTEMILWCNMNKAQRGLYEEYKNYYRNLLLKKIDDEGMGKSGIYILEGLLRLRQICDHPSLVKADGAIINESVKTEELMREIEENSGSHKLLVFSQFTEMLHIISRELEASGTPFCYLDGSTPAAKRKEYVERFQEDETIKVFLISLKAGGVGLNLTAADYVYMVDPWWNPAVEQQAIDRTHRIGQTRKIFAYKMICKDTVEEKILQLQQKKKSLADDLINEDSGFIKKLTKEDVAFLFS